MGIGVVLNFEAPVDKVLEALLQRACFPECLVAEVYKKCALQPEILMEPAELFHDRHSRIGIHQFAVFFYEAELAGVPSSNETIGIAAAHQCPLR